MQRNILILCLLVAPVVLGGEMNAAADQRAMLIRLSQDFIYAVKTGEPTDQIEKQLGQVSMLQLVQSLTSDNQKKTFWINLYNGWYQVFALRNKLTKSSIFTYRGIKFSDFTLTLDEVEHGILRKYRAKYSLGYFAQMFPGKNVRALAVGVPDFRVHFALNCGAKSCPPIAFYSEEKLDQQLERAARGFLQGETKVDRDKKIVWVTRIMQWFAADFGGKSGQLEVLSKYLGVDISGFEIRYQDYDWTPALKNFAAEP
ncbi:MAG: DUF547 domain-containing protein [Bacteroidetes bacterium]|nr:DUF547 domain-containing protein [Bacteroidota bacterium]